MKKVTFLTCVLALCTSTMFAQTLEVTTADMDPVAAGGLVYVIDHAESGSVIEFNFDGEVLDYGEGTGIAIKGKKLTFNGINKILCSGVINIMFNSIIFEGFPVRL